VQSRSDGYIQMENKGNKTEEKKTKKKVQWFVLEKAFPATVPLLKPLSSKAFLFSSLSCRRRY